MFRHLIYIALLTLALVFLMFRPYMPGSYDQLAVTISAMVQIGSYGGLLLILVGGIWLLSRPGEPGAERRNENFWKASLIVIGLLVIIVSLIPLAGDNPSFATLFLVVSLALIARSWMRTKEPYASASTPAAPLYLILIPLIVVAVRVTFIDKAVEYSRNLAIRNSEALIQEIENHFERYGRYPISLQALHGDISPGVVGIKEYCYEPYGEAYNVYFKHSSQDLAADEIVMYNKRDEHAFASHRLDILEYTGNELALRRGDRRRVQLSTPHWMAISFD
ncbi:MAG TPA: hypothetical protein VIL31_01440 [Cyclobacteriaceae bacterium]|jgi:hypothetical protein|nr:hypothetical protein [Cyclobacteriaceae bacterium]